MIKNLLGKQLLFLDGAMGTLLQEASLQEASLKNNDIPEIWNISHSNIVKNIHEQYLAAGSDIILTNTFGCNAIKLKDTDYTVEQVVTSAVENAKKAIETYSSIKPRYIALDIGPTGKLLKPLGDLHFEEAVALFKETVIAGVNANVDLILIETMTDVYELKAAVLAAKENCDLPIIASVTLDDKGKMLTGGTVDVVITLLEGLGVDVIGFNCGFGPEQFTPHIKNALKISSTPLLLMPNAGLPDYINGITHYDIDPIKFAEIMQQNAENGVWLLGGCCGTTPAHIEQVIKNCTGIKPAAITKKSFTIACSYNKTVEFGNKPIIIGERINPTGKSKLKKALIEGDYNYILQEGISQTEHGADALDVNAGVPGIDEEAVLIILVEQLQGVTDTPLQIDTANIEAMSCAMRIYNGKPIINSVNGKISIMDSVFPLMKKYGGIVIALTLDENGIPETVEGRIDIAKKILKYAEGFGITKEAFVFDPLTMAVSAGQDNARITLDCVRLLSELGVKTSLGVSNVSFGLPERELLNSTFLSLALEAGLNAAIINPNTQVMHQAIEDYVNKKPLQQSEALDALLGKDENFKRYIETYGMTGEQDQKSREQQNKNFQSGKNECSLSTAPKSPAPVSLNEAVLKGLRQQAVQSAQHSLELHAPLEVIEQELIPALNTVGELFEQEKIYLPQLLMSAEAAKNAFTVIREKMGSEKDNFIGTIIIATVEGDIHDIGKNIVRAMLENYRFKVIDLGKDVPVRTVVEAVQKHNVKLVGLSALMTTTVVNMEKTIQALREAELDCKVICGGAVLTKEYAKRIGADYYAKDAMATVRYAQEYFSSITASNNK
jgi:5-methyltetrahydrofolate--homocysteine methyltransferase